MKAFVFELEAVLAQRQREERERQVAVAALESRRLACERRIGGLQDEMVRERLDMHQRMLEGGARRGSVGGAMIRLGDVKMQAGASFRLMGFIRQEVMRLAEIQARLETARGTLMRATTARKAVERLRQRRLDEWQRTAARREAHDLDEMAVMRASRGREP